MTKLTGINSKMTLPEKVELLAPAGDFEKLETAVHYGADAVYLGGKDFSLRNFSGNFTLEGIESAVHICHGSGVKVYVAVNIYPRNAEMNAVSDYLTALGRIRPDAVIIADPGAFLLARRHIPHIPVHLSTQANTTNIESVRFWRDLGAARINLARELSLAEIREIALAGEVEIEAFVHGAMCISYSGRCLLSAYLTGRDGNQGMCAHPCRWGYAVVEETRPGHYMPIAEDDRGSYIFSSRDICMVAHLPAMIEAGIHSLKIEGRMKSVHYLATTVSVYRKAVDAYYENPREYVVRDEWIQSLSGINHRGYGTGFYFGDPAGILPGYTKDVLFDEQLFLGRITGSSDSGFLFDVRNRIDKDDPVEIMTRNGSVRTDRIIDIRGSLDESLPRAHPGTRVCIRLNGNYEKNDIIRKCTTRKDVPCCLSPTI